MRPLKQVGLRLPDELLTLVDQHAETAGGSRSETLRQLIEVGLERDLIDRRLTRLETRLDRIDLVLERIHELVYIGARGILETNPALTRNLDTIRSKAKSDLANILVTRFGQ